MSERETAEVFEDHLMLAAAGEVERDIACNFAEDVVLLTGVGVFRGHDGVRRSREILGNDLPGGRFTYVTTLVEGAYAFLEWRGQSDDTMVDDGADSFVIHGGLIRAQTIHYTVRHRMGRRVPLRHVPSSSLTGLTDGAGGR